MSHHCHAAGCNVPTPPEMFTCRRHWFMLPKRLRDRIWATYRPGQCDDWAITSGYADAAREAVTWLGRKEGKTSEEIDNACRVYDMLDPVRYGERVLVVERDGQRLAIKVEYVPT